MSPLLQVRDVPDEVRRKLRARAAAGGLSLSEYLRTVLSRAAERPTPTELAARIEARGRVEPAEPSEVSVRRLRDDGE